MAAANGKRGSQVLVLQPPDDRTREQWERSGENWEWVVEHPEVLEPYRGEYVVIWQREVVAHGEDPNAVRSQIIDSPYWQQPFLAFSVPTRAEAESILAL